MNHTNSMTILIAFLVLSNFTFGSEFDTGFHDVRDALKASDSKVADLLHKVTKRVVKYKGGAGVAFLADEKSSTQLVATARHLETNDSSTAPINDFLWTSLALMEPSKELNLAKLGSQSVESKVSFEIKPGESVVALGFPLVDHMSYTVGTIMSDVEVDQLQKSLGIENSDPLAYDPNIERYVFGRSYQGMSGGPVFNSTGQWIGTLIRGGELRPQKPNDWKPGIPYFRFLTAKYMIDSFKVELKNKLREEAKLLKIFSRTIEKIRESHIQRSCGFFYSKR